MSLDESKAPQPKSSFELIPARLHYARCVGLLDLGIHPVEYKGEQKDPAQKVEFLFELPYERIVIEKEGEEPKNLPRWISVRMNVKTGDKATLTKLKKALGITKMTDILNLPVCLNIIHDTYKKDGEEKTIAKVGENGVTQFTPPINPQTGKPDTSFVLPALENPLRVFDFDEPSKEVWDQLPKFQQDFIRQAINFQLIADVVDAKEAAAPAPATTAAPAPTPAPAVSPAAPAPTVPATEAAAPAPTAPVAPAPVAPMPAAQTNAPVAPAAPTFDPTGRPF